METAASSLGFQACLPPRLPVPEVLPPILRPPGLTLRWKHGSSSEAARKNTDAFCVSWRTPRWWTSASQIVPATNQEIQEFLIADVLPNETVRVWVYAIGKISSSSYSDAWEFTRPNDLFTAAFEGDAETFKAEVESVKEADKDLNMCVDADGNTLAHWLAFRGHCKLLEWLAQNHVSMVTQNPTANTPLHWACTQPRVRPANFSEDNILACVRILLAHNANINATNNNGRTAVTLCVQSNLMSVCDMLIKSGADVTIPDTSGDTVAHWAAHYGCLDLLKQLIENSSVGVEDKDLAGQTVLHIAAARAQVLTVKYLTSLNNNSLLEATDNQGRTAKDVAQSRTLDAITQLLDDAQREATERMRTDRRQRKSTASTVSPAIVQDRVDQGGSQTAEGDAALLSEPTPTAQTTPVAEQ